MSLLPLLYRDWWNDLERPSRLLDQNFGLGLRREDLLSSVNSSLLGGGYLRPWREFTRQNSGVSTVQVDKGSFQPMKPAYEPARIVASIKWNLPNFKSLLLLVVEDVVILDVPQFAPGEITVKTLDRTVVVEGKHNEKADEHGYISRHFVRKYLLPADYEPEQITSTLSSDGVLTITAPKKAPPAVAGERIVPIKQTGPSRPVITEPPASPLPTTQAEETQIPVIHQ